MASQWRIARFVISGLTGLSVNLLLYRSLVELFGAHYLLGSVVAVCASMIVGFLLQKFWTFQENSMHVLHMQFVQYVTVGLCNIGINTAIVYLMVSYLSVHYLVAQTAGAGVLALWSYFAYSRFIFAAPSGHHTE